MVKKSLLAIVCILIVVVGIWQWGNIQVMVEGLRYSKEEIQDQINKSKEDTKVALEEYNLGGIRDLTVEEEQQLMKGEISVDEAVGLIMNKQDKPEEDESEEDESNKDESKEDDKSYTEKDMTESKENESKPKEENKSELESNLSNDKDKIVEKYVGQMYTLQASYLSALGNLEARARALYKTLPKEERNLKGAKKLAGPFIDEGIALEGECDAKVQSVLSSMKNELEQIGADTSIIATMRDAYNTQKRLKKSYYLSAIK